jgi:MYXO-CTERM domain-containing protein
MLTALLLVLPLAHAEAALHFDGVDDHVTMGRADSLGLASFTVECWFRWDGAGAETAGSGSGGVSFYPLVAKGRGESDGSTVDMNWGLGIEASSGTITADFEDMADGTNHPVLGTTDVRDGAWHHAAVTYDGSAWALYLDGALDGSDDTGGATPRHDSVQHLAVATAMNSEGSPAGRFRGAIDEVRVWSRARSQAEILGTINQPLTAGVDLVSRWGFDEGSGSTASDAVGGEDGSVVGAAWTAQAPFDASFPPSEPTLIRPADGATGTALDPELVVQVEDPEGDEVEVRFYGRPLQAPDEDFTLVMLPDTQYYCSGGNGGAPEMFLAQTEWIVAQREALNIAWVAHVGDLVNDGDSDPDQWLVADEAMAVLEDPLTTGLSDGIPYGIAPGNHDQSPNGDPEGTTEYYNATFGADRFADRAYYGGHWGSDNDDHWGVFTANGLDFMVIDLEFDQAGEDDGVLAWADALIEARPDHRVIINAHHLLETDATLSDQGQLVYEALGHHDGLFLMLSGHLTAEAWRSDPAGTNGTVHTVMADYQFDGDGGAGWLRVMTFSPPEGTIRTSTYSPWLDEWATDSDSLFELPYTMETNPWQLLGSTEVASGSQASLRWDDLDPETAYEWFAEANDGHGATASPTWSFETGDGTTQPGDTQDTDDGPPGVRHPDDEGCGCASRSATGGWLGLMVGLVGVHRRRRGGPTP